MKNLPQGITFKKTPGHGFFYLSPERLAQLPENLRMNAYEEDCDWAIPFAFFMDEFPAEVVEQAKSSLKDWHPDFYEQMFNTKLRPQESYLREKAKFYADNIGNWFVTAAWGDWKDGVPLGYVEVCAVKCTGSEDDSRNGEEKYFFVKSDEYQKRSFSYIIDLTRDLEINKTNS